MQFRGSLFLRHFCALAVIGLMAGQTRGDDAQTSAPLARRSSLGTVLEPDDAGIRIRAIIPGSSAEAAGLQAGDILTSLNGEAVGPVHAFVQTMRAFRAGTSVTLTRIRDGQSADITFNLKEWPREPDTDLYRVEYGALANPVGLLRTITMVPKAPPDQGNRHPALLVIQGLGAATLDNPRPDEPLSEPTGMNCYRTIAATLADAGFVTMRVDKGGCGDSQGSAALFDFNQELDAYRQALKTLKARDDVDPGRIFLFGHSMGGVFGPIIAAEDPVRGVSVYGTVLKTWLEYLAENSRRQAILGEADPVMYDQHARGLELFHHGLAVQKASPVEIFAAHPGLREQIADELMLEGDTIFGRYYTFFQQLNDVNIPEKWRRLDADVLAMWGVAEFVTGRDDHEQIVAIVNSRHPGKATFLAVPETDHGLNRAATPKDAHVAVTTGAPARFNPAFLDSLKTWMLERSRS